MRITAVRPGLAQVTMTVRADMVNGHGICHGGLMFALGDSAFAFACNSPQREHRRRRRLHRFPGRRRAAGDELTAEARELWRTQRNGLYEIIIFNQHGERIALFRGRSYRIDGQVVPDGVNIMQLQSYHRRAGGRRAPAGRGAARRDHRRGDRQRERRGPRQRARCCSTPARSAGRRCADSPSTSAPASSRRSRSSSASTRRSSTSSPTPPAPPRAIPGSTSTAASARCSSTRARARASCPTATSTSTAALEALSKGGTFVGQHICVPLEGAAVHINAFNFPVWGMLEKLAPTLLAGVPAIVKPATQTCYLTERVFRRIIESGMLPAGARAADLRQRR